MSGTCSTSIKVVGVASIGLLGASLSFLGLRAIPNLIRNINSGDQPVRLQVAARLVRFGSAAAAVWTAVTSVALAAIYRAAPTSGKHPYLIYTAVAAPLALGLVGYKSWKNQKRVLAGARGERRAQRVMRACRGGATSNTAEPAGSRADDLAKSYIHVSDEESSSQSTPGSSAPGSPQAAAKDLEQELSIEEEVEQALRKKEHLHDLQNIADAHVYGAGVALVGFVLGAVGLVGDIYY